MKKNNDRHPMRTCIGCHKKREKEQFLRLVYASDSHVYLDEKKRMDGRGCYVCNDESCVKTVIKKRTLNRTFKTQIADADYQRLEEEFFAKGKTE